MKECIDAERHGVVPHNLKILSAVRGECGKVPVTQRGCLGTNHALVIPTTTQGRRHQGMAAAAAAAHGAPPQPPARIHPTAKAEPGRTHNTLCRQCQGEEHTHTKSAALSRGTHPEHWVLPG